MAGAIEINYNKVRNPQLREFIEKDFHDELFDVTTGHDHDGVNSPALSPSAVIANDSVTTVKILDGAVTAQKIGTDAVTADKILAGAVGTAELGADAVTGAKIADNAVDSEHITAGAIDTAHIGNLQVTTAKIAADAVNGTKLADAAVDSEHIAAGAIDLAHMSANSVDSDQYVDGSIDTVHIADDQVTNDKLANISRGYIKVGGASDAPTDLNAKTSGQILIGDGTDLKSVAVSGDATLASTGALTIAALAVEKSMIAADAIDGTKIADNAVDSEHITAGAIDLAHMSANSVDSDQYVDGSIDTVHIGDAQVTNVKLDDLARGSIKVGGADDAVTDLVANTDGYILIGDGTDLNSVAVSGDITITNTGAVTIANNAVENAMLADNSVDSAEIVAGAVDTAHLSAITTPTAKAIADPGTGKAIPVTGNGNVALTLAGVGETNTLAVPTFAGQILTISADTVVESATRIVTVASAINVTGNNTITFDAAGEFISLYGIKLGETFAWKILAYDAGLSTVE